VNKTDKAFMFGTLGGSIVAAFVGMAWGEVLGGFAGHWYGAIALACLSGGVAGGFVAGFMAANADT